MKKKIRSQSKKKNVRKCGLCGKKSNLTRTECCNQWICDDEDQYILFSYDRNSCSRNHRRFTLCGYHHTEEHSGTWQECSKCKGDFETELYVFHGTNEYNFEKLKNPPKFEPTKCSDCGETIVLSEVSYSVKGKQYLCANCFHI